MIKTVQHSCSSAPVAPILQGQGSLGSTLPRFPSTRYQGSKRKILAELGRIFSEIEFDSVLDLYSGSGMVSLLLRHMGKRVDANDYQLFNQVTARLFLQGTAGLFSGSAVDGKILNILSTAGERPGDLVSSGYGNIFFTDSENSQIDGFCDHLNQVSGLERDLCIYAVGQALLKKRPYNLFHRANLNMRRRDVTRSFGNAVTWETSIQEHALKAVGELRAFPFGATAKPCRIFGENTVDLGRLPKDYDLIYLDPPYLNSRNVGVDYSDFYGFLEGLCDYSLFAQGDEKYPHKPIARKHSNWAQADTALGELSAICAKWKSNVLVLSYRSDGLPRPEEINEVLSCGGRRVEVHGTGEYKYALSTTRTKEELFLVSFP